MAAVAAAGPTVRTAGLDYNPIDDDDDSFINYLSLEIDSLS